MLLYLLAAPSGALADIDPASGIDFVRITHPNNAPWPGNGTPDDIAVGRGSVPYEYRIGRLEITSAQWVEFLNAAYDRPANDRIPFVAPPVEWGGTEITPDTPGGRRWFVPESRAMRPVGGISWRTAAVYCNWLCHDKALTRDAFLSGAYDVSTFGYGGPNGNIFTDQLARTEGARYFIPTWDEWLKASHWSPDRFGLDQPGWWLYSNTTEAPLVAGPPGMGEANFGFFNPSPFSINLGSYPHSTTPWGLLDAAGATAEWTESIITTSTGVRYRLDDGSYWASTPGTFENDRVNVVGGAFPETASSIYGLRIAAQVPSPASSGMLGFAIYLTLRCRRRGTADDQCSCSCDKPLIVRPHMPGRHAVCSSARWRADDSRVRSLDGTATVQDISDFLAHYFLSRTAAHTPSGSCWRSADVNGVGGVSIQDIFDFPAEYFSFSGQDC